MGDLLAVAVLKAAEQVVLQKPDQMALGQHHLKAACGGFEMVTTEASAC